MLKALIEPPQFLGDFIRVKSLIQLPMESLNPLLVKAGNWPPGNA